MIQCSAKVCIPPERLDAAHMPRREPPCPDAHSSGADLDQAPVGIVGVDVALERPKLGHATQLIGIALGVILVMVTLVERGPEKRAWWFELILVILMTVSMFISRYAVSRSLHSLRLQYGDQLASLALSDPVRISFNQLHRYSVWLMGFNLIAAIILIAYWVWRSPATQNHD